MAGNTIGREAAPMNVGTFERIGSTLMGTALIFRALGRPSLGRLVMAIGGAALLQRGLTGHCTAYQRLGISTALHEEPELDASSPSLVFYGVHQRRQRVRDDGDHERDYDRGYGKCRLHPPTRMHAESLRV